jgi:hypothetical protein
VRLRDILDDPARRARFLDEGVRLVDAEVARKSGLSGMAIRTGFRAIQKVRPDIVRAALDMLLPAFEPAIEPKFQAAQAHGDVAGWFRAHATDVAQAMLAVTDAKAARANNAIVKGAYQGLRGQALTHVVEAMPAVGTLLASFLPS